MKTAHNLLIILMFVAIGFNSNAQNEKIQLDITHGPYLVEPGNDCMTVIWTTNKPCQSWVEYCGDTNLGVFPKWGGYPQKKYHSKRGLKQGNSTLHCVRLNNLEPGTKYRYRVMSKEIIQYNPYEVIFGDTAAGEILEFETISRQTKNFTFGAVSDMHERSEVLKQLLETNQADSLDMVFYVGDMLNWIGDHQRIFSNMLDASIEVFASEKPMLLARGNHETRGANARELYNYFPHSSGQYYYAFSQGDTRFIILDSGEDKPDDHPVYAGLVDFDNYRTEQQQWLKKEVQSEAFLAAKKQIVMCHIPLFSGSKNHGATDITQKWGPILNEAGIDLIVSGHHHQFAYYEANKNGNKMPVLVLGQDMLLNADVSSSQIKLSIKDLEGKTIETKTIK